MNAIEKMLIEEFHLSASRDDDHPNVVGFHRSGNGYSIAILYTAGLNTELDILITRPDGSTAQKWIDLEPWESLCLRLHHALGELFAPSVVCENCAFPTGHADDDTFPWSDLERQGWVVDQSNGSWMASCPLCYDPSADARPLDERQNYYSPENHGTDRITDYLNEGGSVEYD